MRKTWNDAGENNMKQELTNLLITYLLTHSLEQGPS
jgi:hypothetical protein